MTGHLNVPALEPDPNTPATLSSRVVTDLLRGQLGFGTGGHRRYDMGGITVRYARAMRRCARFLPAECPADAAGAGCRYEALLTAAFRADIEGALTLRARILEREGAPRLAEEPAGRCCRIE